MKIIRIEAYKVDIELLQPFVIAIDRVTSYEGVVVKVLDDQGNVGWGEASPSPAILGETCGSVLACLDILAKNLIGRDPRRVEEITEIMDRLIYRNTAAKAAVDMAIHDLLGQAWGVPLWRLLGGTRERIETDFTIGIQPPHEMAEEASRLVANGFRVLKLKVGMDPEEDIKRVRAVRNAVGDKIRLRIDANQGWTRQQAIYALKKIAEHDVEFVEQPVQAHDITGLAIVRRSTPIPVMADESVHQPEDAIRVIKEDAVDYINIKLMKSGGFRKALKIAEIAEAAGIECMVGGMVETDLGLAAAVHFAAAVKNVKFGDLDLSFSLKEKLVRKGGATFVEGYMIPSEGPGLGVLEFNEKFLQNPIKVYE
jgi:o-succinylbenzoate synthase